MSVGRSRFSHIIATSDMTAVKLRDTTFLVYLLFMSCSYDNILGVIYVYAVFFGPEDDGGIYRC